MSRILLVVAALALSCERKAERTSPTSNAEFQIERLFTHDGCTVYRFADGNYRYFVKCAAGERATVEWQEPCGKGCTRDVQIDSDGGAR